MDGIKDKNLVYKVLYAFIIFLSAFLIFIFEPVAGKVITPQYGGGADIWTGCLVFFQLVLFLGYLISFFLNKLKTKTCAIVYGVLFVFSLLMFRFPLEFGSWLNAGLDKHPLFSMFVSLFKYAALPVLALSTVSVSMQNWYVKQTGESPYILYSISNVGSFLGLFLYPFVYEPIMGTSSVMKIWHLGFIALCALIVAASCLFYKNGADTKKEEKEEKISIKKWVYWIGLSALGTVILASYTTYFSVDMFSIPLIWSLFLGVYLLTFVLCFGSEKNYNRNIYKIAVPIALVIMALVYEKTFICLVNSKMFSCIMLVVIFFLFLMVLNGEIYKTRPHASRLSEFYLAIAFGGVLGGLFVNIVAPLIFNSYLELPLVNCAVVLFVAYLTISDFFRNKKTNLIFSLQTAAVCALVGFLAFAYLFPFVKKSNQISTRNFYGVAIVTFSESKGIITVSNGNTLHGAQIYDFKTKKYSNTPLTYYSELSAFDYAYTGLKDYTGKKNRPLKIGVIGLGAGTVASYIKDNDSMTFYEIDPKMRDIAQEHFAFLKNAKGKVDIVMGDARISLDKAEPQGYDLILVDAFTSDAIPVHLITKEAFEIYQKHLKEDGVLLFHISNRHIAIDHVLNNTAEAAKLKWVGFLTEFVPSKDNINSVLNYYAGSSYFVVFMPKSKLYDKFEDFSVSYVNKNGEIKAAASNVGKSGFTKYFTDDYSSLVRLFYFWFK